MTFLRCNFRSVNSKRLWLRVTISRRYMYLHAQCVPRVFTTANAYNIEMLNIHHERTQTFGFKSLPCCMRVPMVNQKLFDKENWFSTTSCPTWHGCGLFHSYGLNRATTNIVTDTKTYAAKTYSQISIANGFMKEKSRAGWLVGTCKEFQVDISLPR